MIEFHIVTYEPGVVDIRGVGAGLESILPQLKEDPERKITIEKGFAGGSVPHIKRHPIKHICLKTLNIPEFMNLRH
jgi:hypothetical protein